MIIIEDDWRTVQNRTNKHVLVSTTEGLEHVNTHQTRQLAGRIIPDHVFEAWEVPVMRVGFGVSGQCNLVPPSGFGNHGEPAAVVQSREVIWP